VSPVLTIRIGKPLISRRDAESQRIAQRRNHKYGESNPISRFRRPLPLGNSIHPTCLSPWEMSTLCLRASVRVSLSYAFTDCIQSQDSAKTSSHGDHKGRRELHNAGITSMEGQTQFLGSEGLCYLATPSIRLVYLLRRCLLCAFASLREFVCSKPIRSCDLHTSHEAARPGTFSLPMCKLATWSNCVTHHI